MFTTADILLGFVVPACVTSLILLLAWRSWRRGRAPDGRWVGALAIGAGYSIAYARFVGDFHFPPVDVDNWIVYFLLPAALIGVLGCWFRPGPTAWIITILLLCAALVWLLLRPLIGSEISAAGAIVRIAALSIAMTVWWVILNEHARRGPRLLAPVIALLVSAGSAAILGDSGLAQRGGMTCAAMTVLLVGVLVIATITRHFTLAGGATLAITIVLFGTMTYGYFYIYPEPTRRLTTAMGLVAASPLLALLGWLPVLRRRPWQRGVLVAGAVFLAIVVAVALVALTPAPQNSGGESVP